MKAKSDAKKAAKKDAPPVTKEEKKEKNKKAFGDFFGIKSTKGSRSTTPIRASKGGKSKTKKSVTIAESEVLDDEMDKMSFSREGNTQRQSRTKSTFGFMTK